MNTAEFVNYCTAQLKVCSALVVLFHIASRSMLRMLMMMCRQHTVLAIFTTPQSCDIITTTTTTDVQSIIKMSNFLPFLLTR